MKTNFLGAVHSRESGNLINWHNERGGFIAIISPVRDLIFTEKIAAFYISSVGAGLAPAPVLYACPSPLRIYFLLW